MLFADDMCNISGKGGSEIRMTEELMEKLEVKEVFTLITDMDNIIKNG